MDKKKLLIPLVPILAACLYISHTYTKNTYYNNGVNDTITATSFLLEEEADRAKIESDQARKEGFEAGVAEGAAVGIKQSQEWLAKMCESNSYFRIIENGEIYMCLNKKQIDAAAQRQNEWRSTTQGRMLKTKY